MAIKLVDALFDVSLNALSADVIHINDVFHFSVIFMDLDIDETPGILEVKGFGVTFIDVVANVSFSGIAHTDNTTDFIFIDFFDSNPLLLFQVSPYRSTRNGRVSNVCSARMERLPANVQMRVQMYVLVHARHGLVARVGGYAIRYMFLRMMLSTEIVSIMCCA